MTATRYWAKVDDHGRPVALVRLIGDWLAEHFDGADWRHAPSVSWDDLDPITAADAATIEARLRADRRNRQ